MTNTHALGLTVLAYVVFCVGLAVKAANRYSHADEVRRIFKCIGAEATLVSSTIYIAQALNPESGFHVLFPDSTTRTVWVMITVILAFFFHIILLTHALSLHKRYPKVVFCNGWTTSLIQTLGYTVAFGFVATAIVLANPGGILSDTGTSSSLGKPTYEEVNK